MKKQFDNSIMAIFDSCCYKWSTKTGSIVIGSLLLVFSVCFLIVTIGLVAAWEDFDTQFLDDRLSRFVSHRFKLIIILIEVHETHSQDNFSEQIIRFTSSF